jgi:UDP-glucose 4-epimerase
MRILITGGAGCLGSNLLEHWIPQGHEILVLDNLATGKREVVPSIPGLLFREGSIADATFVSDCFRGFAPQVVIHAAASYKDPNDWKADAETNVLGTIHVLQSAQAYEVRRFINFQTTLCYGRPQTLPIPTSHPLAPFTSYGISKTAAERYLLLADLPVLSLRIANVTAPRLSIGPIPTFYQRLKSGRPCFCTQTTRDFLDIHDFLALLDLAIQPDAPTGIYHVSSGESHSIKEIYDLVAAHLGVATTDVPILPCAPDDVPDVTLDPSDTIRDFSWTPTISFPQLIDRQLTWYDQFGVTDVYSHLQPPVPTS